MALNINQLNAITQDFFLPKMADNILDSNALYSRMKKGNAYQSVSGGTNIKVPLAFSQLTAKGWFKGLDTLDTTDNSTFTAAQYEWAHSYVNITISDDDEIKNSGESQVIDLVKAKTQWAESNLRDLLGTALYSDGTDADSLVGLGAAVDSTTNTYGGIDRTSNSWWNSQVDSTTTTFSIADLTSLYGDCKIDNDAPTMLISPQDQWDNYHGLLQPQERFQDASSADGGFRSIMFMSTPFLVDSHCPDGYLYMLNEKYLMLKYHPDKNFAFEPFRRPTNQAGSFAKIYWSGQFCTNNARMQGVMNSLS